MGATCQGTSRTATSENTRPMLPLFLPNKVLRPSIKGIIRETTDPRLSTCYRVKRRRDTVREEIKTGINSKSGLILSDTTMQQLRIELPHKDKTYEGMIIPERKP